MNLVNDFQDVFRNFALAHPGVSVVQVDRYIRYTSLIPLSRQLNRKKAGSISF